MKFTYKDYMALKGIKSRNTIKKYVRQGLIKEFKGEDGKLYIIDTQIDYKNDINLTQIDNVSIKNDTQETINLLNLEIKKLQDELKILQYQIDNKDRFIEHLQSQIQQQYNMIQSLQYQVQELSKNNTLLLEYKEKKWYQFWK